MRRSSSHKRRGAALIIVLIFVVLLTGLALAYFSRTISDRQIAQSSFNQTSVDQLASSAVGIIVGDLRQEIINGSASPAPTFGSGTTLSTLYAPTATANIRPMRSGNTPLVGGVDPIPNLIRRSVRNDAIPAPGILSRASTVNSTTDASANGRSVTPTRWNRHYLIEKDNKLNDEAVPVPAFTGYTPDWVMVTAEQGATLLSTPTKDANNVTVTPVGRYAYAIYDEGGLLDINVAGYPSGTTIEKVGRKGSLAFADLTALPSPIPNASPIFRVDRLVGWRNYATVQAANNFPVNTPANQAFATNLQSPTSAAAYANFVISDKNGFLKVRSAPSPSPYPWNGRTDQMFMNRQELIAFRTSEGFTANALQYLSHFSREAEANSPQWSPSTPDAINPNFQTLRVTGTFIRNDGVTQAIVGEPFVKKRFLLQRLNWLTYKGPSALRSSTDPDINILTGTYGVALSFLQQGTAANILKYFGLAWDAANERWNYVGHAGSTTPIAILANLGTLTASREPDFFELLRAGILDASLGDTTGNPPQAPTPTPSPTPAPTPVPAATPSPNPAFPIVHQQSKMLQVLTIGANVISQARTDSYPTRIACSVDLGGGIFTTMEAVGAQRLPYVNSLAACAVGATQPAGGLHWMVVPNLWNPFRNTWDMTETTTFTPQYPRPLVRIRLDGTVAFGSITASASVKSGAAAPADVFVFPTGSITVANQTLPLTLLDSGHGRDGFREANRLRTGDTSNTVTQFITTNSPATTFAEWNSLTTSGMSGSERYIVFRFSLAGNMFPTSVFLSSHNPVLVLNPGFRVVLEYQSPTGTTWYPYSYLQGNSASNTWIGNTTPTQNLNLVTTYSTYGKVGTIPTLVNSGTSTATPWALTTLASAPMFAKADPRSIRYNSQLGVITLPVAATAPTPSAGVIGSIWPNAYASIPDMAPDINPAFYSQVTGDNSAAASNPYSELNTKGDPVRPLVMNRPFRTVGEMAYAFRDQPFKTLDFSSAASPDAGLLDLFSVGEYNDASGMRAGVVNVNTRQGPPLTAVLNNTIGAEGIPGAVAPSPVPITKVSAANAATSLTALTSPSPLVNKANITGLIGSETGLGAAVPKTQRESIARALGEVAQTRTWNLMIDVIAQSGRYPSTATSAADLPKFIVEGEQRYWVHVAIDRFTGKVVDRQIEVVKE